MSRRACAWTCWIALSCALTATMGCIDVFSDPSLFAQEPVDTGSGGTGGTGGTSPDCIPNQTDNAIADGCGVFVAAATGKDTNAGTKKEAPLATLAKAIEVAKGKPIYACADATKPFDEAITIDGDVRIFGGVDCTTWEYLPNTKTKWTAGADELPLRASDGASIEIEDVAIEAGDATKDGGSSIAILAQAGATVDLLRCDVTAGNGEDGLTPEAPMGSGTAGVPGDAGLDGCVDTLGKLGGNGGALLCGPTDVGGGPGGNGVTTNTGGVGSPGQPEDGVNGLGGAGQKDMPPSACTDGGQGAGGLPGDPGAGATGKGSLSASGFEGASGVEGVSIGQPGQGGGGGGGANKCSANAGPSAGGGGSGGCGGAKGQGGKAGGASIAIVSLGATLVLSDVKITAKNGGKGGDGGPGQAGGDGGVGGMPGMGDGTAIACAGGTGGKGGPGGRGGGGRGGHSIGIAHTGGAPDTKDASITTGAAGDGGAGDGPDGNGEAGLAEVVQVF